MDAGHNAGRAALVDLDLRLVIAGPDRHHAVAFAVVLSGLSVAEDDERVVLMARHSALGGDGLDTGHERHALRLALHAVAAVKVQKRPVAKGEIEAEGGGLFQPDGLPARVGHARGAGDDVLRLVDAVEQLDFDAHGGVGQRDAKRLRVFAAVKRGGQTLQFVLSALDRMPHIAQVGAPRAVFRCRQQRAEAVVAGVRPAVLLRQRVQ